MKLFGFAIIRWNRLQEMHTRRAWLQAQLEVAHEEIGKILFAAAEQERVVAEEYDKLHAELQKFKTAPGPAEDRPDTKRSYDMNDKPQFKPYDPEVAYWSPKNEAANRVAIREAGKAFAKEIQDQTPPGPEQTLALRHVEEATFRALHAMTREEAAAAVAKGDKKAA